MYSTKYRRDVSGVANGSYNITEGECSASSVVYKGNAWSPEGSNNIDIASFGRNLIGLESVSTPEFPEIGDDEVIVQTIGNSTFYDIAYNNGLYVLGTNGGIAYSNDGINWNTVSIPNLLNASKIVHGSDKFVTISSDGYTSYSTNGINWSSPIQLGQYTFYDLKYLNGYYIIAGSGGYIGRSEDGINWDYVIADYAGIIYDWTGIVFSTRYSVINNTAYGNKRWMYSSDLINWNIGDLTVGPTGAPIDRIFVNSVFFMATSSGLYRGINGTTYDQILTGNFRSIKYNDGVYVAAGNGNQYYSTNGRDFISLDLNLNTFTGIYAGGRYIFGALYGTIATIIPAQIYSSFLECNDLVRDYSLVKNGGIIDSETIAYDYNTEWISDIGTERLNNRPIKNTLQRGFPFVISGYRESCNEASTIEVLLNGQEYGSGTVSCRSFNYWVLPNLNIGDVITANAVGGSVEYTVVSGCSRFALYYVNKYGGIDFFILSRDSYFYNRNSQFSIDTNYDINEPSSHQYKVIQNTDLVYMRAYTGELKLSESRRIDEMLLTPKCWLYDSETEVFYAAVIEQNSFEVNELHKNNRDLNNYTFDIQFAQDIIRRG